MTDSSKHSSKLARRLVWLTAVVLIVPWLGIKSLSSMKTFLVEGQEQAQLLTASGIASLLSNRPELFADSPQPADGVAELPLYPSHGHKVVDGYVEDWQNLRRFAQTFSQPGKTPSFSLIMAEQDSLLYGFLRVSDSTLVTRHPGLMRMDQSDHVRLYLKDAYGKDMRVIITFEGNGSGVAYLMDENWQYAEPGTPEYRLRAKVASHPEGYAIEFRMPLEWLGQKQQMGLAVVDVADSNDREIAGIISTFPRMNEGVLNPVIVRSSAVESLLQRFSQENARLWILDDKHRVKAIVGTLQGSTEELNYDDSKQHSDRPWWRLVLMRMTGWLVGARVERFEDFDASTVHTRNDAIYQQALKGLPVTDRRKSLDGKAEIVTAANPIKFEEAVIGVLLLEKSTTNILQLQRESVESLVGFTVLGMLGVSLILLMFAYRLTWRIRRLGRDAAANVDQFGRFVQSKTIRGKTSADEIGELARVIEKMLGHLSQHQAFLQNIPRTLRHEINNPLSTIATSLERLENVPDATEHIDAAYRGINRINHVVNSLAEAASLEQALEAEHLQVIDLNQFLEVYIRHQSAQSEVPLNLLVSPHPVEVMASGEHLEEMLDKLLDNARDFSQGFTAIEGELSPVRVSLESSGNNALIRITNKGSLIPEEQFKHLFHFMSTTRENEQGDHFGLGLYIVRVIVEHHRGTVIARNLADKTGVEFLVTLPLIKDVFNQECI